MKRRLFTWLTLVLAAAMHPGAWAAAPEADGAGYQALDEEAQSLQQEILEAGRDLLVLEEEGLFPAATQVLVFVSMDIGAWFELDSLRLQVGGREAANHLYTQRENGALKRGGAQRLYIGNLKPGEHELAAVLTGKDSQGRVHSRSASLAVKKGTGPVYIEIKIVDQDKKQQQPDLVINAWE